MYKRYIDKNANEILLDQKYNLENTLIHKSYGQYFKSIMRHRELNSKYGENINSGKSDLVYFGCFVDGLSHRLWDINYIFGSALLHRRQSHWNYRWSYGINKYTWKYDPRDGDYADFRKKYDKIVMEFKADEEIWEGWEKSPNGTFDTYMTEVIYKAPVSLRYLKAIIINVDTKDFDNKRIGNRSIYIEYDPENEKEFISLVKREISGFKA